jgi:quercetin dioxygenase-like cupin family protein
MKMNEATLNRPEGDRVIDAPYVLADLAERTSQLKDEKAWEESDRNAITLVKSDKHTIVLVCLREGAAIMDNSVDGILTVQVIKGAVEVTTDTETFSLGKKTLVSFRRHIVHSIKAETKAVLLLTTVL